MRSLAKSVVVLSIVLVQPSLHAQIYVCKDANGRTITSDRYIPECANRAVRVLDRGGIRRGEIQPPLTAEQKRELELQEEKRKAEMAALEEQKKNDRALRLRYRNEADIEQERQRSLSFIEEQIRHDKVSLALAEKQLQAMRVEAEVQSKNGTALSLSTQRRQDEAEQSVREQAKVIKVREEEIVLINKKYDQTIKRYREINKVAAK